MQGKTVEVEVVEGRPPKTIDVPDEKGGACRYCLAQWTQEGMTAVYTHTRPEVKRQQLESGGWALYPGGRADVSSSVKAYLALRLAGLQPDHPEMARACAAV